MGLSGRPVIVVIDDDPSMRALVRLHLTRDVPVVLLTGDDDVVTLAKAVGAADCLRKPIAAKRLLEATGALVPRLL